MEGLKNDSLIDYLMLKCDIIIQVNKRVENIFY